MLVHRMRQAIGGSEFRRHVDADALGVALGDEGTKRRGRRNDIVRPRLLEQVAAGSERSPLDTVGSAIGEDVVADAGDISPAEVFPERLPMVFLYGHDPHVDAGVSHRQWQDLLELVEADLALDFPTAPGLLTEG
ncbi:MAG: hypothetical protein ACT4QD_05500 [Acidobacteriota bacterium]